MIQSDAAVFVWLSFLMLLLPLDWLLGALISAAFHEFCHILVLIVLGGKIRKASISLTGCVMESTVAEDWRAFFSILAGPIGSLLLVFCSIPQIAVCGLIQGLYNLFPVMPLDGGRLLQIILSRLCPRHSERLILVIARVFCCFLLFLWFFVCKVFQPGLFSAIIVIVWILRFFPRKIPCKPSQIKVQ